jgi:hypothetical protein
MRRHLDQYFTPLSATRVLLKYQPNISGTILEPCVGQGDLAAPLRHLGRVVTNDIDTAMPADFHQDAALKEFWEWIGRPDWVVSNPPFSCCQPIIAGAFSVARRGVAMLLRLSYLEPCNNRADFLSANPPSLIVLPRISFTGDGKTDNVTCAWFVWDFSGQQRQVNIVTKDEVSDIMADAEARPATASHGLATDSRERASYRNQTQDVGSVHTSGADRLRDLCDL